MNDVESFDEYFESIEAKKYNRNLTSNSDFYVFENIKIIISKNKLDNSLYFESLGEFQLFLQSSKSFDSDNCFSTINFTNRKLKSIGDNKISQSFYVGFEDTF